MQRKYWELSCYQRGVDLAFKVYNLSRILDSKRFSEQVVGSSVSIPSNIAEGAGARSTKQYAHFLSIALGSCSELETQLLILQKVDQFKNQEIEIMRKEAIEIRRMISVLRSKVLAWT